MGTHIALKTELDMFVVACCVCEMQFAMTADYEARRREDHAWWHCPAGHSQHFSGKTDAEKLRERKIELERMLANSRDDTRVERMALDAEKRKHASTKAQLTKVKNRAEKGTCLHCRRHFVDVARHVQTKHPEVSA